MNTIEQIKHLRKTVSMKQGLLASFVGQNPHNYSAIENGSLIPKNLPKIIDKATKVLLPLLDEKIHLTSLHLGNLHDLRNEFAKSESEKIINSKKE